MFELIEPDGSLWDVGLSDTHPIDLDKIDSQLEGFLDKYGGDAKRQNLLHPSNYRINFNNIVSQLGCSDATKSALHKKTLAIEEGIDQLKGRLDIQDQVISDSTALINERMVEYTKVVVSDDSDLIEQLEESNDQLEKNIKWAGIRKKTFNQELEALNKSYGRVRQMTMWIDNERKKLKYNEAYEKFKGQLNIFVGQYDDFCQIANHMPNKVNINGMPGSYAEKEKSIASQVMKELEGEGWGRRV